jgi:hypothetical protein
MNDVDVKLYMFDNAKSSKTGDNNASYDVHYTSSAGDALI